MSLLLPRFVVCLAMAGFAAGAPGQDAEPAKDEGNQAEAFLGTLNAFGAKLRLLVELTPDGEAPGTLLSPDQSLTRTPLSAGRLDGRTLSWRSEAIGASFTGTATAAAPEAFVGFFKQGLLPLPLTMTRISAAEAAALRRPPRSQTPSGPFSYQIEKATFPSADGPDA
ncbi:MAG: hypothetical protein AAF907_14265, partial [Planctomycetota bacterium]